MCKRRKIQRVFEPRSLRGKHQTEWHLKLIDIGLVKVACYVSK